MHDALSSTRVSYASTTQPSSARLRACSHAFLARFLSTVPPRCPSTPESMDVSHVFTTKLVLASSGYVCDEVYIVCKVLSRVVVETCVEY